MMRRTRFPSVWVDVWRAVRDVMAPLLVAVLVLALLALLSPL